MVKLERRELLKLIGVGGGVVYASRLLACASDGPQSSAAKSGNAVGASEDFYFLQLSDTHWGFSGPMVNPNADMELPNVIATINSVSAVPDFVIFTGDLTHTTDDDGQRRQRLSEFQQFAAGLNVPMVKFIPGEHDAAPDAGAAFKDYFGDLHYSFDHKGIHFIALDNCSDPMAQLGDKQLAWLQSDLKELDKGAPIVVFTHRPLWDLKPDWDWTTADGQKAIDLLMPYSNVTVFFGHIHQTLHQSTGHIQHHAARSLMFAFPPPETPGDRNPIPWDPDHPEQGLGYRQVEVGTKSDDYTLTELAIDGSAS